MLIRISIVLISLLSFGNQAMGDISETLRSNKAVVRYEFEEASGNTFLDSADPKFGAALPLTLKTPGSVSRGVDSLTGDHYISLDSASVIRSDVATKVYNSCSQGTSTGITIEAIVENNESVELRAGEFPKNVLQPLRILSYSRKFVNDANTVNVNFALGQFYDMGNIYLGAATTAGNNNLFSNPLQTSNSVIMINGVTRPATSYKQKIVFTVSRQGIARLYVSDRKGNLYQTAEQSTGFGGTASQFVSRWANDAFINVGNDFIADADISSTLAKCNDFGKSCTGAAANNPNRFWKGKIYRLAVYCDALTREDVFGDANQIQKNNVFPISNVTVTPKLLKAADIYERLTGVKTPIYNPVLQQMETMLNANNPIGAAQLITDLPMFYNNTVKNFAARMSNRDETINTVLNDFTATVIGAVRDNINAKQLLYDNFYYQADPAKAAVASDEVDDILKSNNHYQALDVGNFDLKAVLVKKPQILFDGNSAVPNPTPAGLLTTRQWGLAHLIAGTNRRAVEYSFREFLCTPMAEAADSSGPEDVISRDIDRNPGGSMAKFTTSCRACHTIMDGFRPAFAYMTFSNNFIKHSLLVPRSTANNVNEDNSITMQTHPDSPMVPKKMNHNEATFPKGRVVLDDKWDNNANNGSNQTRFGWTKMSGQGVSEYGKALAETKAFPRCMAKRVFFTVCKREATFKDDDFINQVATEFSSAERNYNLKYLFERIVTNDSCLGGN